MKIQTDKQYFGMEVERRIINGVPFVCPKDIWPGLKRIFDGSYDVSPEVWRPQWCRHRSDSTIALRIGDFGANVGAFALFARARWPEGAIASYEPDPDMFRMLEINTAHFPWGKHTTHDVAVGAQREQRSFHKGVDSASGSFWDDGPADAPSYVVDVIAAKDLGPFDVIKLDIEGAEWEFLDNFKYLDLARYVAIEYHRDISERQILIDRLAPMGFVLVKEHMEHDRPGELIFVKKEDLL